MKKVIVLLTVAVLLVFGLAITPVFGNLMQCITRDRYGNIAYVSGEDGSWQVPILVYSDSDINVYIPDGMISSHVVYGIGWNPEVGKFSAIYYIEYKKESSRKKIASDLKKSGARVKYPDLFCYLEMFTIFDMQNKMTTINKKIFIDRDGEIMGWSGKNITIDLNSHSHESYVNMQIAKNISEVLNKASKDPKLADSRKNWKNQNAIVRNMVKNYYESIHSPDGGQMQLQGKDANDINSNSIEYWDNVIKLDPNNANAYNRTGVCILRTQTVSAGY